MASADHLKFAVLVRANAEWAAVKSVFSGAAIERSAYGGYFFQHVGDGVMAVLLTNLPKWMAAMTLMTAGH